MTKIKLKISLKSSDEKYTFNGKGILRDDEIIYKDKKTTTIIELNDVLTVERRGEYYLRLLFKKKNRLNGEYMNSFGNIIIETYTKELKIRQNKIKLTYELYMNENFIDTFEYNLEYSIDR